MHYRTLSIIAAGGAALTCASAQAQAPAARAPAAVQPLPRTEVTQKLDAEFKSLDTNGDGKLTKAEVQAAIQKRAAAIQATLMQQQKAGIRQARHQQGRPSDARRISGRNVDQAQG